MPVKISSDHFQSYELDPKTSLCVTDFQFRLSDLCKPVELEEGLTIKGLFDVIQAESELRNFVEGYFECDIDAIASTPTTESATVFSYKETPGGYVLLPIVPADHTLISCSFFIEGYDAFLDFSMELESHQSNSISRTVTAGTFQAIMHLPIKIEKSITIFHNSQEISRKRLLTLLDLLESVFSHLLGRNSTAWNSRQVANVTTTRTELTDWVKQNLWDDSDRDLVIA